MTTDANTPSVSAAPGNPTPANPTPPPRARRWPRRVAVGVVVTGALLAGAYWYLGRETTLQTIAQKVASASGGKITLTGVSGSLYGSMHIGSAVYRTPEQVMTANNIDIDWSPFQYLSKGIAINKLHVATLRMQTLKETDEPTVMPASLAPPFNLNVNDVRIGKVTMAKAGVPDTAIDNVRFDLQGDKQRWKLSNASASTPWGVAKADASIGAARPFKLDGTASLTQSSAAAGQIPAQLTVRASGDLTNTLIAAAGQSGKASGTANLTLAPFEPIALRAMSLHAKKIDPTIFNPTLPTADLSLDVEAKIGADRSVAGTVAIDNLGKLGPVDKQLVPLHQLRAKLDGNLNAMRIAEVLADFGAAGKFTGNGTVQRTADDTGIGSAAFVLHTDRFDLRQVYSTMKQTAIAGDMRLASDNKGQSFDVQLADKGMRLDAKATLIDNILQVQQARLAAGRSSVRVAGSAGLAELRPFKVNANAVKFNPADFGDFPAADINAEINASGELAPAWKVAADFALRPSTVFGQSLTGKGKLQADPTHVSNVDAALALGKNSATFRGAFGAPGEQLLWKLDARDLSLAKPDLYGTLAASGAITGTIAMPRTSFVVDGRSLGWTKAGRTANTGVLNAKGDAWLTAADKNGTRGVQVKTAGSMARLNPAAFGSPLAGSINGSFDANGGTGGGLHGAVNLALQPSTLSNAPLWGYAKLSADAQRISNADVDLHVGPNILNAKGSFGAPRDRLDWKIDAPQLAALGPDFAGVLRGSGVVTGTKAAPSLAATLEGSNLKLLGQHQIKVLRASANVGSGRGAADPLVSDIEVVDYVGGAKGAETRVANVRLKTTGTRGAHTVQVSGRGDAFDAAAELRGGFSGDVWTGVVAGLQNKGRYAMALQSQVPLRQAAAPGAGVMGLMSPQQVALSNAVIKLPDGTVSIQSLNKTGTRWSSKGVAAGVPLLYLAQFSPAIGDNLRGDLTLGGDWAVDMQAPAVAGGAPVLNGRVHVFREKGDVIAGSDVPVALGLTLLDLRADVVGGALRMQAQLDGSRAGQARVDATAQMIGGRLGNASPLKLTANADMASIAWIAPLAGQPGLELDGALKVAVTGAGTVGVPTLNGTINGDNLSVRSAEQGVKLRNGQLRAVLAGDTMNLQRLSFDGAQGRMTADGAVRFSGGEATMNLKLVADKLEILSRPDRTLVLSGQSTLLRDAKNFTLEGKFRADRALIELAPQDRPTLSSDVIVLGRTSPATKARESTAMPLAMDVEADLGDSFRLRGMGIDSQLAGKVRVRIAGGRAPRVNGGIRVVDGTGTYKAYGQNLTIERGVLTFSGPYDNPSLNILAVRKRPEGEQLTETNVEAGVQVRGTALSPVAKLVSTPSVPDSEKLSWLVLGHGMEGVSGNEAGLLGAAAGALLGGSGSGGGFQERIANSLGVDELGLSQAAGLESTVVTVGKKISSRAYLSFEQGATTASSLVKLRYKLNPRITLQFQTGTNTALDVLYSWAFD